MITEKIKEYAKLIRLKAMGVSTVAVLGALSAQGSLEIPQFLILFTMGIIFNILGFVLNDYIDYNIDKRSREISGRPLVKGTISRNTALGISIICYILLYAIALTFYRELLPLLVLTCALLLGTIYDIAGKKFLGSDIPLSASIAFFCLFGATTVSSTIGKITIIISSIYFIHVLYFNIIEGGFKDADNDKVSGAKTTASFLGVKNKPYVYVPKTFFALAVSIEATSAFLIFIPFFILPEIYRFDYWPIQLIIILILTITLVITSIKILKIKIFDRKKVALTITKQEVKRYMIIPIILVSFADIIWLIFILLLPAIWYLSYTVIFREKMFKSKML